MLYLTVVTATPAGMSPQVNVICLFGHVATIPMKAVLNGAAVAGVPVHVTVKLPLGAADVLVQGPIVFASAPELSIQPCDTNN